jgi:uncharacterized integral membrane protein
MNPLLVGLIVTWGLVTGALVVLIICRARLESKETDWIPLTNDAREERAIQEQAVIGKKAHKLDWPIRVLGTLSVILLLAAMGYWIYSGLSSPLPPSE